MLSGKARPLGLLVFNMSVWVASVNRGKGDWTFYTVFSD